MPIKLPIRKIVLLFVLIALIGSLIPILLISQYNHPSADDFSYGDKAYRAFQATGSPIKAVKAAAERAAIMYNVWQGTYSACFLMALQPSIWGENGYFMSTVILLFSLIFSTLFFSYKLFVVLLKSDRVTWLIIGLIVTGISIQFVPSPVQSFFWYNGSIYYTFFYSLSLTLFGLMIGYMVSTKKRTTLKHAVIMLPLAVIIGGGNYVTALVSLLLLLCFSLWLLIKERRKSILPICVLFVMAAGLFFSIMAPGNAVRQARLTMMPPVKAVFESLIYGAKFIAERSSSLPILIGIAFILPFLFLIVKNTEIRFRYPLLVLIISFCIFSAQFTPTLYSMGGTGDLRVQNIRFFSYVWLLIINLCYSFGWFYQKLEIFHRDKARDAYQAVIMRVQIKYALPVLVSMAILFFVSITSVNYRNITSVSAVISLVNGEAVQYDREIEDRLFRLHSDDSEVVLSAINTKPYVLYFDDISDPPDWRNEAIANYYGKESVTLE